MIVSFIVFVFILVFFLTFWFNGLASANSTIIRNNIEYELIGVSDNLLKTPGYPSDWETNTSNITSLGLVREPNVLYPSKLANFTNLSYANLKTKLGISYEFYFYVQDLGGNNLYETGNATIGEVNSVAITRFAVLSGQPVKVGLIEHD
jgi:hypothetical protein